MNAHTAGKPLPEHVLWVDIETSGLDPETHFLLEVAVILTDSEFRTVDHESWIVSLHASLDTIRFHADPHVQQMHEASGLWEALAAPGGQTPIPIIDAEICTLLDTSVEKGVKVALAGSGVGRFDSRWIDVWLPRTAARLEYWALDIGAVRRFLGYCGLGDVCPSSEGKAHRAVPDVVEHLDEAREYRARIGRPRTALMVRESVERRLGLDVPEIPEVFDDVPDVFDDVPALPEYADLPEPPPIDSLGFYPDLTAKLAGARTWEDDDRDAER